MSVFAAIEICCRAVLDAQELLTELDRATGDGEIASAAEAGCEAISELGGAKEGDKTMLDALVPFARALRLSINEGEGLGEAFLKGADAAKAGAEGTARMKAKRGRASYLGDRAMGHRDGGAVAAAIWLRALASSLVDK